MQPARRGFLGLPMLSLGLLGAPPARAQPRLGREVRLLVGFAPGGTADVVARLFADEAKQDVGRGIVVENRTGAGGFLAMQALAASAPDGHQLGVVSGLSMTAAPLMPEMNIPIDVDRDLAPVARLPGVPMVLVARPDAPFGDLRGLLEHARAKPGEVTCGTSGQGGSPHMAALRLARQTGVEFAFVPYRGGPAALLDLVQGRFDIFFALLPEVVQQIRAGSLRAVATGDDAPLGALPGVPPVASVVPGFDASAWYLLAGPGGLAPEWRAFWSGRAHAAMTRSSARAKQSQQHLRYAPADEAELPKQLAAERSMWRSVLGAG